MSDELHSIARHLCLLEEQLLQPETRRDPTAVAALLADDFREFGSSGRSFTKPEIIAALAAEAPRKITVHDFACQLLSGETALVTYRSQSVIGQALRSSLWVQREGRWRMLFHQGTKLAVSSQSPAMNTVS